MKDINELKKDHRNQFEEYYNFLIETNNKFNLTSITDKIEVFEKHFDDSLQGYDLITNNSKIIDIGAGAGFPSVPLAIVNPSAEFTLIDSLKKRICFLESLKNLLKIKNISPIHSRIEDFASKNRENFDFAIARAVASLPTLLEYSASLVKIGGKIIAYKGSNYQDELKISSSAIEKLGLELESKKEYYLPNCNQNRVLLIFKKIKKTPNIYPRDKNKPRKEPL